MHYSLTDYLALEEESPVRHEYLEAKAAGVLMLACTGAELRVDKVYAGGQEDV